MLPKTFKLYGVAAELGVMTSKRRTPVAHAGFEAPSCRNISSNVLNATGLTRLGNFG